MKVIQRLSTWQRWALAGVATVLLVVVGGPFVYFRLIQGDAPAPLSLSAATVPTTAAPTTVAAADTTVPAAAAAATSSPAEQPSAGDAGVVATAPATTAASPATPSTAPPAPATTRAPTTTAQPAKGTTTAKPATSPSSTAAPAAPTTTTAGDQTWKVSSGSQAGYRVKETVFGQSGTAVGRTSAVSGSMVINGNTVRSGSFVVQMAQVTSDSSQRDNQYRNRIMETSTYPTSMFTLTKPTDFGPTPVDGEVITREATGTFKIHGVTRTQVFQVAARHTAGTIQVSGSIPVVFADWNIDDPSGGPAKTEDHGIMEFIVNLTRD